MNGRAIIIGLSFVLALSSVSLGETLEAVELKIGERLAAAKTLQMKQKTTSHVTTAEMQLQIEADSVVSYARKPENKWVSRIESKTRTVRKTKDEPEDKQDSKMLVICDGKDTYMLSETAEITSAMKQKLAADAINPFDVKALFAEQRKNFDLKLLADERVDSVECYVIESVPKKGGEHEQISAVMARAVNWYDKKTGIAVKGLVYDKEGKVTTTTTATAVKIDEAIADDQFVFKAPPGVSVMDMDALQQAGAQPQPADQSTESSPPQAEPAQAEPAQPNPATAEKSAEPEKKDESAEKKKDPAGKAVKGLLKGLGR